MGKSPLEALLEQRESFVAFVAARVSSRAAAEDIVQEALARALDRAGELRSPEAAVPWFYQVLRNAITDQHRRAGAAGRALERLGGEVETVAPPVEPPARTCQCVARLARELKAEYAEAIQRVEVEGVAVKDFAGEQGISSNNAAVRVHRARESLKKKVTTTCGACAALGCTDCSCVQPA
jgi:RNA polymerase sigma-70 factor (ECF subfamily)